MNIGGAPVAPEELHRLTASLAFRGPDAQEQWHCGTAGLGHTMLRTTDDAPHERQPASLDGLVWITADARIDARDILAGRLAAHGRSALAGASDAELILHAYHAWGEDCVAHLLGDFAFAIWDGPRARLFCARDHFGVKPFFYARTGDRLVACNTLNTLRGHGGVSSELDELWIADFLLFEASQDPAATAFSSIRRLPPAHCLAADRKGVRVRQYWTLPFEAEVCYRASGDYVERFSELLQAAVKDRLRTTRVAVELSGGLDSTTVAATAAAILSASGSPFEINALTIVYDRLIADGERPFTRLAAAKLGIALHEFAADRYRLYEPCAAPPEPSHAPRAAATLDLLRQAATLGRVTLTGWDGDTLFNESPKPYFRTLLRKRRLMRLISGIVSYGVSQRRLIPLTLRERLKPRAQSAAALDPGYPSWIQPELESRLGLRARWEAAQGESAPRHPIRPYAFRCLDSIMRQSNFFEYSDAGVTGVLLEHRHPLMDLRLQEYCLSLPPLPWCVKKEIVRRAMRSVLPEAVRRRPKTPLAESPDIELLSRPDARWIDDFVPARELARFVDRSRIPSVCGERDREARWRDLRPLSLSVWLQGLQPPGAGAKRIDCTEDPLQRMGATP